MKNYITLSTSTLTDRDAPNPFAGSVVGFTSLLKRRFERGGQWHEEEVYFKGDEAPAQIVEKWESIRAAIETSEIVSGRVYPDKSGVQHLTFDQETFLALFGRG